MVWRVADHAAAQVLTALIAPLGYVVVLIDAMFERAAVLHLAGYSAHRAISTTR